MLLVEAIREICNREGVSVFVTLCGGIAAVADGSNDRDRARACLVAREHRARAKAYPAWPTAGSVLDDELLPAARQHPYSEAGYVVVPQEVFRGFYLCRFDGAFGQFRHSRNQVEDESDSAIRVAPSQLSY